MAQSTDFRMSDVYMTYGLFVSSELKNFTHKIYILPTALYNHC